MNEPSEMGVAFQRAEGDRRRAREAAAIDIPAGFEREGLIDSGGRLIVDDGAARLNPMHWENRARLSREAIQGLARRWTYRPGWIIDMRGQADGQLWCVIDGRVVDARDHTKTTSIGIRNIVPPIHSENEFWEWLMFCVQRIEMHECREFFQVDGKPWDDPHS